jgi:S1-C subfamily serine protease
MAAIVLDLLLVLVLLGYLAAGVRNGLVRSLGGIAGVAAGGVLAYLSIPLVSQWVPNAAWRVPAILAVALLLISVGNAVGGAISSAIAPRRDSPLRSADRLAGGVAAPVVAALVVSTVALGVAPLGIPVLSPAISGSRVLTTIDSLTPGVAKGWLAQARSYATEQGIPTVVDAFDGTAPTLPEVDLASPGLTTAAASVVRITGTAIACGQGQSGSGFVTSDDRVITNAHVVAGVEEPFVEAPGETMRAASVVYFDPVDDIAVLEVPGLHAAPLVTGGTAEPGTDGAVQGYPYGGPFTSIPAGVLQVGALGVQDIYGADPQPREVYTLASDVEPGNSGGPLLTTDGVVVGLVFAKGADVENVGYAATMAELQPVLDRAPGLTAPVSAGTCVAD